jgi:hypothetical protein
MENRSYRKDTLKGLDFKIESGVEISQRRPTTNKIINAMKTMKLGDSLVLPGSYKRSGGNLRIYATLAGIEVTTRKQADGEIRMWRIR